MWEFFDNFVSPHNFIPHEHCYLWKPELIWLHLLSDLIIALSYYSLAVFLVYFAHHRQDLHWRWILWLFGAFSVCCGTTHLMAIWTLWYPVYWLSGLLKAGTAVISLYIVLQLQPLVCLALAIPSLVQIEATNLELKAEIQERQQTEAVLRQAEIASKQVNQLLEQRVRERTAEEEVLHRSEELYRTLAQNFPNGAVKLFDRELRYTLAEGTGLTDVGLSKENVEGKTIWDIFPAQTSAMLEPFYQSAFAGKASVTELSYSGCIYRVHIVPVRNEQGDIFAGMSMSQNITLQKQAEQNLREARDELEIRVQERTQQLYAANFTLEQLNAELQRSNQELEQFAYVASHDLQEPLRAVAGYTQLLADEYQNSLDKTAQEYITYIIDGAARMSQLIQDLLAYSRVNTKGKPFIPTDCNSVLPQVLGNLQVLIAENNATITYDSLPTVIADKTQLVQLFQNLISNAIKFRREELPQIQITAELEDKAWLFSVTDNGIGIKSQYIERIFQIFQRLHTRREVSGTGIGLAICKKIVERHHGHIWAESEPGIGTTFYFTIPHLTEDKV